MVYRGCTVEIQPRNENNNLLTHNLTTSTLPPHCSADVFRTSGAAELLSFT